MPDKNESTYRLFEMLGIAILIPLVLASGPLAGYFLGECVGVKFFKLNPVFTYLFIGLGFLASAIQTLRFIQRIQALGSKPKE